MLKNCDLHLITILFKKNNLTKSRFLNKKLIISNKNIIIL